LLNAAALQYNKLKSLQQLEITEIFSLVIYNNNHSRRKIKVGGLYLFYQAIAIASKEKTPNKEKKSQLYFSEILHIYRSRYGRLRH
jgi:hypothetical protein